MTHEFSEDSVTQSLLVSVFNAMMKHEPVNPLCMPTSVLSASPDAQTRYLDVSRTVPGMVMNKLEGLFRCYYYFFILLYD